MYFEKSLLSLIVLAIDFSLMLASSILAISWLLIYINCYQFSLFYFSYLFLHMLLLSL